MNLSCYSPYTKNAYTHCQRWITAWVIPAFLSHDCKLGGFFTTLNPSSYPWIISYPIVKSWETVMRYTVNHIRRSLCLQHCCHYGATPVVGWAGECICLVIVKCWLVPLWPLLTWRNSNAYQKVLGKLRSTDASASLWTMFLLKLVLQTCWCNRHAHFYKSL